jgi:hypothetical protein
VNRSSVGNAWATIGVVDPAVVVDLTMNENTIARTLGKESLTNTLKASNAGRNSVGIVSAITTQFDVMATLDTLITANFTQIIYQRRVNSFCSDKTSPYE